MKYYTFNDWDEDGLPVSKTWSEEQILSYYWKHWTTAGYRKLGEEVMDTYLRNEEEAKKRCIEDFVVVWWCVETDKEGDVL